MSMEHSTGNAALDRACAEMEARFLARQGPRAVGVAKRSLTKEQMQFMGRAEVYDDMVKSVSRQAGELTDRLYEILDQIDNTPDGAEKDRLRREASIIGAQADDHYAWARRLTADAAECRMKSGEARPLVNFKAAAE